MQGNSLPQQCNIYVYTRETPAFGVISLALRGSGASGAAFSGGKSKKKFGVLVAPHVSGAFGTHFRGHLRSPIAQKLLQGHEDSEYMLCFEIGQREIGF